MKRRKWEEEGMKSNSYKIDSESNGKKSNR
jgi:hypothetical protein